MGATRLRRCYPLLYGRSEGGGGADTSRSVTVAARFPQIFTEEKEEGTDRSPLLGQSVSSEGLLACVLARSRWSRRRWMTLRYTAGSSGLDRSDLDSRNHLARSRRRYRSPDAHRSTKGPVEGPVFVRESTVAHRRGISPPSCINSSHGRKNRRGIRTWRAGREEIEGKSRGEGRGQVARRSEDRKMDPARG